MHSNARSLLANFDKFNLILANLKKSFSVIGVSETWLSDHTSVLVNITGQEIIMISCTGTVLSIESLKLRRWMWHLFTKQF